MREEEHFFHNTVIQFLFCIVSYNRGFFFNTEFIQSRIIHDIKFQDLKSVKLVRRFNFSVYGFEEFCYDEIYIQLEK